MKKLIIRSSVASEVMNSLNNKGRTKTRKALSKSLKRSARQQRRERGGIISRLFHRQIGLETLKKVSRPILVKSVMCGELDALTCGKIETEINKSINNPLFRIDPKYMDFIAGKLKERKNSFIGRQV
jgi:hypothetical protein